MASIDKTELESIVKQSFDSSISSSNVTIPEKIFESSEDIYLVETNNGQEIFDAIMQTLEERGENVSDFIEKLFTQLRTSEDDSIAETLTNQSYDDIINSNLRTLSDFESAAQKFINTEFLAGADHLRYLLSKGVSGFLSGGNQNVQNRIKTILDLNLGTYVEIFTNSAKTLAISTYIDGITETDYGALMQSSWVGTSSSFLETYVKGDMLHRKIKIMKTTPLDPGEDGRSALFGTLIMGTPYTYGGYSDPRNRQYVNTFIKDGRIVTFTPGFPNYNGGYYYQRTLDPNNTSLNQTRDGSEMLDYLLKNGIDKSFASKDKRFYTFKADYETYYAYLEAMLNPIWLKLGLGTEDSNTFNIFSFFKIKKESRDDDGEIDTSGHASLKNRYRSSIGFYLNGPAGVAESVSSDQTSYGAETSGYVNDQSDIYQQINYLTGMGSDVLRFSRLGGIGKQLADNARNTILNDLIPNSINMAKRLKYGASGSVAKLAGYTIGMAVGVVLDTMTIGSRRDINSMIQSFAVSNGLKTVHPELWANSSYSKSINLNFEFVSPYGDPMSIFKYVYVPFCSLLTLSLPRAAADNGYVSPMFIRCDIPGLITSDLAMVSDITWVKGGSANIWTKDNLPRAISVSLTISDLYPFLAMSKRFSYLSANPSYSVFLDNMAGLCSVYDESMKDDPLNAYFDRLLKRVDGVTEQNSLWNRNSKIKSDYNKEVVKDTKKSVTSRLESGVRYSSISYLDRI